MTENEKRTAAKEFANYWKDRGYEKGESQPFWLSLLRDVLGIDKPEQFITFENIFVFVQLQFCDRKRNFAFRLNGNRFFDF